MRRRNDDRGVKLWPPFFEGTGHRSVPPLHGSSSQPLFGSDPEHEVLIDEWVALFSRKYGRTIQERRLVR